MSKRVNAYFVITYGLQGCYMPDSDCGATHATTRREIADALRNALALYEAPANRIRHVSLTKLWQRIVHAGSASSVHFCIATDKHNMIEFHGLTEDEYNERMKHEDC